MKTRRVVGTLIGFALLSVAVLAQTPAPGTAPDPKLVANGRKLFETEKCNICHLAEGKGNKKLSLDGIAAKMTMADIRKWIASPAEMTAKLAKKPAVAMPKKADLKDADVDALVAFVLSLKQQ